MKMTNITTIIRAVAKLKPEKVRQCIEEGNVPKRFLTDIGMFQKPFSLQEIVKCWELILKPEDFSSTFMPYVIEARQWLNEIKELLASNFEIDFNSIEIDFHVFEDSVFFKAWQDDTLYDIIDCDNMEQYNNLLQNVREIDLELTYAVGKMNLRRVEELLKQGANPQAMLHTCAPDKVDYYNQLIEDEEDDSDDDYKFEDVQTPTLWAGDEEFLLWSNLDWIIRKTEPFTTDIYDIVKDIIGLAAYTELDSIINTDYGNIDHN